MSDKERLEEIKNIYLEGLHRFFGTPWVSMPKENFDWLIQQAEKIELLNAEIETLQAKWEAQGLMIQKLHRENQRYKQALEFYADEDNYCVSLKDDFEPILQDNGKTAQQALGWGEEN